MYLMQLYKKNSLGTYIRFVLILRTFSSESLRTLNIEHPSILLFCKTDILQLKSKHVVIISFDLFRNFTISKTIQLW